MKKCIMYIYMAFTILLACSIPAKETKAAGISGLIYANNRWEYWTDGSIDPSYSGLTLHSSGEWFFVQNGIMDVNYNGFADYDGQKFWISCGRLCKEYSGIILSDNKWYFLSAGMFQRQYTGLALYDGEWFYLTDGILRSDMNQIISYDGSRFLLVEGRLAKDVTGLTNVKLDGQSVWAFLVNGEMTSYTGLVDYNGQQFFIQEGRLAEHITGLVEGHGQIFYVKNGMVVEMPKASTEEEICNQNYSQYEEGLGYVNQYRRDVGAQDLTLDRMLCVAATKRAIEMVENNYFEHARPDGRSCFTVFGEYNISYRSAGENIAMGYRNMASVCDGWYNSPGHYSNMVNTRYHKIGFGRYQNMWVQLFTN